MNKRQIIKGVPIVDPDIESRVLNQGSYITGKDSPWDFGKINILSLTLFLSFVLFFFPPFLGVGVGVGV